MKKIEYRVPRERVEVAADELAKRFFLDPDRVMCDFQNGTIEVRVEELEELLKAVTICASAAEEVR